MRVLGSVCACVHVCVPCDRAVLDCSGARGAACADRPGWHRCSGTAHGDAHYNARRVVTAALSEQGSHWHSHARQALTARGITECGTRRNVAVQRSVSRRAGERSCTRSHDSCELSHTYSRAHLRARTQVRCGFRPHAGVADGAVAVGVRGSGKSAWSCARFR